METFSAKELLIINAAFGVLVNSMSLAGNVAKFVIHVVRRLCCCDAQDRFEHGTKVISFKWQRMTNVIHGKWPCKE